ncbi:hypothetical protein ABKA04_008964 [Annulohypoxylon sp. FPYF3050]
MRATAGTGFASPSTSPAIPTGPTLETQPNPPYHQLATMSSISSMNQQPVKAEEDETYSTESKVPPNVTSSRAFGYEHGTSSWVPTDPGFGVSKATSSTNDPWANYQDGLSETSDLSSYVSHAPLAPLSTGWSTASPGLSRVDSNSRLDDAWRAYPPGTRSMSYSDDQSSQFAPLTRPYDRTQPPFHSNVVPEASMGAHGSLSAGAVPHATYSSWRQPYQYSRSSEDYGGWYEDREHQASEAHMSSAGEDPSQAGEEEKITNRKEAEQRICLNARRDLRHIRKLENTWGIDKNTPCDLVTPRQNEPHNSEFYAAYPIASQVSIG